MFSPEHVLKNTDSEIIYNARVLSVKLINGDISNASSIWSVVFYTCYIKPIDKGG